MQPTSRRKGRPKGFASKTSPIQSLDRALGVLETLANNTGLTLTELSTALDQSPATMYRVLSTLEARKIVEVDAQTQAWHIGPMAFRLGSAFLRRSSVIDRSRPMMRALMDLTGETSNLGIERRGEVMFVSQVETHESIRAFFPPGTVSPMHASGIGKALLGQYSDDRLAQFLRTTPLERFTENTIWQQDALRAELRTIRAQGFAVDDAEKTTGMRCVAAPILDMYGEAVAGISVSGPSHRLSPGQIIQIGAQVRNAAATVSRSLGAPEAP